MFLCSDTRFSSVLKNILYIISNQNRRRKGHYHFHNTRSITQLLTEDTVVTYGRTKEESEHLIHLLNPILFKQK